MYKRERFEIATTGVAVELVIEDEGFGEPRLEDYKVHLPASQAERLPHVLESGTNTVLRRIRDGFCYKVIKAVKDPADQGVALTLIDASFERTVACLEQMTFATKLDMTTHLVRWFSDNEIMLSQEEPHAPDWLHEGVDVTGQDGTRWIVDDWFVHEGHGVAITLRDHPAHDGSAVERVAEVLAGCQGMEHVVVVGYDPGCAYPRVATTADVSLTYSMLGQAKYLLDRRLNESLWVVPPPARGTRS